MRLLRHTLCILAAVLVLLSQPFAFQAPSGSQSQPPSATNNGSKPKVKPNCTSSGTYVNSKGQTVPRPENCSAPPEGVLHNAETVPTASARADVARVPTTVVWPSGYDGDVKGEARVRSSFRANTFKEAPVEDFVFFPLAVGLRPRLRDVAPTPLHEMT